MTADYRRICFDLSCTFSHRCRVRETELMNATLKNELRIQDSKAATRRSRSPRNGRQRGSQASKLSCFGQISTNIFSLHVISGVWIQIHTRHGPNLLSRQESKEEWDHHHHHQITITITIIITKKRKTIRKKVTLSNNQRRDC